MAFFGLAFMKPEDEEQAPQLGLKSTVVNAYGSINVLWVSCGKKDELKAGTRDTPSIAGDCLCHADCAYLLGFARDLFSLTKIFRDAPAQVGHY